jgi:type IV pilus assembly protein PilB
MAKANSGGGRKLGEILIEMGLIDAAGLARALEVQARDGRALSSVVSELGLADEKAVSGAIADRYRLDWLDSPSGVHADAARLLPGDFCVKHLVVPVTADATTLRLAMVNPVDLACIQEVEFRTNRRVVPMVAAESVIRGALDRQPGGHQDDAAEIFGALSQEAEVEVVTEDDPADPRQLARDGELPQTVRLVTTILVNAVSEGASDIHLEAQEASIQVRYRVDGLLQDVLRVPKSLKDATISRLKIMSGMDIAERRKPQDGRSQLKVAGRRIDLRVSTLPTQYGEKIVIRILDGAKAQIDMTQLGIAPETLERFQRLLAMPQGMVLVTGPTGSGKTSTLYAALNWVKSPTKNIVTIEDPIEFRLPGINQVQINPRAGLTFASGLRSFLRQDPNVVLVGEIRDQETAKIALEASQTGHLLFSTLHTNDAAATVTRLVDLGIEGSLIASSVTGILAQRLVRRVCTACAAETTPPAECVEALGGPGRMPAGATWRAGRGCEVCKQSGYKGRIAIHELIVMTPEIRSLVSRHGPEDAIREAARRDGARALADDGVAKAAQGLTTLEEVARVAPRDALRSAPPAPPHREVPSPPREMPSPPREIPSPPREATVLTASPVNGAAPADVGPARILVVDDSPTMVHVISYFLQLEGYTVESANDGEQGLAAVRRAAPDLIVTDVDMPRMNGFEMVRALRVDPLTAEIPILMLTARTSVENETEGLATGADDYVAKPVEPRRLGARVRALLARARRDRARGITGPGGPLDSGQHEAAVADVDGLEPRNGEAP